MDSQRIWRATRLMALGGLIMTVHDMTIWAPATVAVSAVSYWILLELTDGGLPEGLLGALLMALYARHLGMVEGFMLPVDIAMNAAAVLVAHAAREFRPAVFIALVVAGFGATAITLTSGAYWLVKGMGLIESVKAAASHLADLGVAFVLGAVLAASFRRLRAVRK